MSRATRLVALLALGLLVLLGSEGRAQERERTGLLRRELPFTYRAKGGYGAILELDAANRGGVQVSAWRERAIEIEARIEIHAPSEADLDVLAGVVGVAVEETPTGVSVKTTGPASKEILKRLKNFPNRLSSMPYTVDYVVWVPEYTMLELSVADGETAIDGVNGIVVVNATRGAIRLNGVSGTVVVSTREGDIDVIVRDRFWRGMGLDAGTTSGSISLTLPKVFSGDLDASATKGVFLGAKPAPGTGLSLEKRFGTGGARLKLFAALGKVTIAQPVEEPAQAPVE